MYLYFLDENIHNLYEYLQLPYISSAIEGKIWISKQRRSYICWIPVVDIYTIFIYALLYQRLHAYWYFTVLIQ